MIGDLWHVRGVYAPGESPFHVRGSMYLAVREYAEAKIHGGMSAVHAAIPQGAHRDFAAQVFQPEVLYDALPLRPVTETIARLEGVDWEEAVRAHAQYRAQRQLGRLGRMRVRNCDRALEQLEREGLESFDFGECEYVQTEQARARLLLREVPQPLGSWFLANARGYAQVLLSTAGGKQITVGGRLIPKGRREIMGLVDVRVDLDWN